ncbi:hypothetical protein [Elongatibacter sediminis]|uniref:Uncharacterized protein n=1 Tax=Elongatibacter sediminis TaxID=3119006 RepID=A0AAW9RIU4_9GAMM
MPKTDSHGAVRPAGIGLLVFTVLILGALFWILRPEDHPLALARDVPLCELLGADTWTALTDQGNAVVVRTLGDGRSICELSQERSSAISGNPPPLARVMLTTEADVRYRDVGNSLGQFMNTFVAEMRASDWTPIEVEGPWRRTYGFTGRSGETALLVEDEGVFLLFSSPQFPVEKLQAFALRVTERLRQASPRVTDDH